MGLNTRMHRREPVPSSVQLIISDATAKMIKLNLPHNQAENAIVITGQLVDISVLGCGIETPYLIPAGVELDIRIDPAPFVRETGKERKEPLAASGKVTACAMKTAGLYRLGFSFTRISDSDKAAIEELIKKRQAK